MQPRTPAARTEPAIPAAARRGAWLTAALAAALVVITVLVYAPVRHFDFVEVDDPLYVSENPHVAGGLTAENVEWAFTSQHGGYLIPLTWVSYMADVEVYGGVNPGGHHVTNLLLHVANTVILFLLLLRATGARIRSAFVAALFAVHPLHVESVAWITERKDVLSTLFWFLGLWAYGWYVARPGWRRYLAIVACVALGLLAKPMLVTFPFVLLLLDVWPLGRVHAPRAAWQDWRPLILEKLPLLVLVSGASALTYVAQQAVGAASSLQSLPLGLRLENAVVSYWEYLRTLAWPVPLTMIYPLPDSIGPAAVAGAAILLLAISGLAVWGRRRAPYLLVGWLWYLGTLVPVIGIVQVGTQARADRFTYVPLIGLFVILVWACADLAAGARWRRVAAVAAGLVVVTAASLQARVQISYWKDSVTLWTHAVESTLGVSQYDAHRSLGRILAGKGRTAEAIGHFEAAVALSPSSPDARLDLAGILAAAGRQADAITQLQEVTRLRPEGADAHATLGALWSGLGRVDAAIREFEVVLRIRPEGGVHNNLGALLAQQGRLAEAVPHFEEAARLGPDVETARVNLGLALARLGRPREARAVFIQVLQQNPRNETARQAIAELPGR